MKRLATLSFIAIVLALVLPARAASAAPIIYSQATDLGGGLWKYDYTLSYDSSPPLAAYQDIVIYFAYDRYQDLQDLTPFLEDWVTFDLDPDPAIPDDGEFNAVAMVDGPAIPTAFSVSFKWLGGAGMTPGAQPFDVLQFDADENFVGFVDSGMTTMIPEPGTLILLGLGLAGLVRARSKH